VVKEGLKLAYNAPQMKRRIWKIRYRSVGVFLTLEVMTPKPWRVSHYAIHLGVNKLKDGKPHLAEWQRSLSLILQNGSLKILTH
jgi:hypothetical protein